MSISQQSLVVNTAHIHELAKQIRNSSDCESIELIIREHLKSTTDLISGIIQTQAKQLSDILPILSLPSPDPVSIVNWISKMVLGTAKPQLDAYIKYTIQLIKLAAATAELAAAVAEAGEVLAVCAVSAPANSLNSLSSQVNGQISGALTKVGTTQDLMGTIVGPSMLKLDVSNQANFVASVDLNYAAQQAQVDAHINAV